MIKEQQMEERKTYILSDSAETHIVSLSESQVRLIYWLNEKMDYDFTLYEQYAPEEI